MAEPDTSGITPINLGFLSRIVSVHFGSGSWLLLSGAQGFGGLQPNYGLTVNFPDQAGGTPGFTLIRQSGTTPFSATPLPHIITAADLTHTLTTEAGAEMAGFGAGYGIQFPPPVSACDILLKFSSLPKSPFHLHFFNVNPLTGETNVRVSTYKSLKAGMPMGGPGAVSSIAIFPFKQFDATFLVDPSNLLVTGPF